MPGVPTGRACENCRRQRKKCDEKQPTCSRCKRLRVPCVGSGVKRFIFKSENHQFPSENTQVVTKSRRVVLVTPRRTPSNEHTKLASDLVAILMSRSNNFDLGTYSQWIFHDLPGRIGKSSVLDASIAAACGAFHYLHDGQTNGIAGITLFIDAISKLRKTLQDPEQACKPETMLAIYLNTISQEWIGSKASPVRNGVIMVHLLQQVVAEGRLSQFSFQTIHAFLGLITEESFFNDRVDLGPWFWALFANFGGMRPVELSTSERLYLHPQVLPEIAFYIRAPERYFYQIQRTYICLKGDFAVIREGSRAQAAVATDPEASFLSRRVCVRYHSRYLMLLTLSTILNRVIRSFTPIPELLAEAKMFCDEIILTSEAALVFRPLGASTMVPALVSACAATPDSYRSSDLEELLWERQKDCTGIDLMRRVRYVEGYYRGIDRSQQLVHGTSGSPSTLTTDSSCQEEPDDCLPEAQAGCAVM